jgi:DNA-directed RNA polymerase specialized sigma24 family protein
MPTPPASGRPRVARRALESARRAPAGGWARARLETVLAGATPYARRVAALLLLEGLTPAEAGVVLGVPAREIERTYGSLIEELRFSLRAVRLRSSRRGSARPRLIEVPDSLRRAS